MRRGCCGSRGSSNFQIYQKVLYKLPEMRMLLSMNRGEVKGGVAMREVEG